MQIKQLGRFEIKDAAKGQVSAVFARFDVIDADKDVTLPGAFADNTDVPISAFGHSSWQGAPPVGAAKLREAGDEAILDGEFFMDQSAGRDTFIAVKRLHERGLGQWSYGYDPVVYHHGEHQGEKVRFLVKQKVHEVSPVLVGAGVGTRTLAAKAARMMRAGMPAERVVAELAADLAFEYKAAIRPHSTEVYASEWDAAAAERGLGEDPSVSDLRSMFAWVDRDGDPEAKSSYKFPHHSKAGGPANARACVAGIAALNGARGGTSIPEGDRRGVYNHLASHLRDANREPPEMRSGSADGLKTALSDELVAFLAESDALLESVGRVVALRAERGKQLSNVNAEVLGWIGGNLRRLQSLLNPADDELAQEYARFVAITRGAHR